MGYCYASFTLSCHLIDPCMLHSSLDMFACAAAVILLLGYGTDTPPKKLFKYVPAGAHPHSQIEQTEKSHVQVRKFSWRAILHFLVWATFWWIYVLFLCSISLARYGGLSEMFKNCGWDIYLSNIHAISTIYSNALTFDPGLWICRTYGFILTVSDLSPNAGVLCILIDGNSTQSILFDGFSCKYPIFDVATGCASVPSTMLPCICVYHNFFNAQILSFSKLPAFSPFHFLLYINPSFTSKVGDSSLYLGLIGLFANELAEMRFSFMLVGGYIGVHLLSPVMHNLWIWRGTGNANFYFATALAYACLQTILIVESVSTMLNHDRKLKKQMQADAVK
ncbi:Phosphatidylinositol glycan anchor biosynthesis class U protein [Nymphaea thermarum]|nr:Phosphatidylinositol glycan anchor biosynthesis class U protein [Nymphaea thermarum]